MFVNRAIHAHRTAALDPHVTDLSLPGSLAVRVGYGDGEALADGRWDEAIELPGESRKGRYEMLAPQERVAAILGHHEPVDAATSALLRARADADASRLRDAALQLRVGLEAMLADRQAFGAEGQAEDLAVLGERRGVTGDAANRPSRASSARSTGGAARDARDLRARAGGGGRTGRGARGALDVGPRSRSRQNRLELIDDVAFELDLSVGVVRGRALGHDREPPPPRA